MNEVTAESWRFSHAIVRETLLDELSSSRRVRQHRKVAAAIETRCRATSTPLRTSSRTTGEKPRPEASTCPKHWSGGSGPAILRSPSRPSRTRSVGTSIRSGSSIPMIRLRPNNARYSCDSRVRRHSPATSTTTRCSRAAELAYTLGDHEQLTAALVITGRSGYSQDAGQATPELIEHLEQAITVVGPDEPSLRAQLLAVLALELHFIGEGERRAALCIESYELALASADDNAAVRRGRRGLLLVPVQAVRRAHRGRYRRQPSPHSSTSWSRPATATASRSGCTCSGTPRWAWAAPTSFAASRRSSRSCSNAARRFCSKRRSLIAPSWAHSFTETSRRPKPESATSSRSRTPLKATRSCASARRWRAGTQRPRSR